MKITFDKLTIIVVLFSLLFLSFNSYAVIPSGPTPGKVHPEVTPTEVRITVPDEEISVAATTQDQDQCPCPRIRLGVISAFFIAVAIISYVNDPESKVFPGICLGLGGFSFSLMFKKKDE